MSEEKSINRTFTVREAEKILRGVETKDSTLNRIKRIEVFKGTDALKYLMNKKQVLSTEAKDIMNLLLESHYIVRVRPTDDQYALDVGYDFNINHEYIWIVEKSRIFTIGVSIIILIAAIILALFPIWPRSIRASTGYLFYAFFGLFAFLIVISIIRLIVFGLINITTGLHFWIFPNLYEDCGILESFVPLYGWDTGESEKEPEGKKLCEDSRAKACE
ncbi:translocation protein SEC62 [Nematocida sp. LUAm3]|nr:translocation protein SEC62 [Nematocida sp. LUAm3]KAI5175390.1 translocation protein SEC62 [Nematocida sp. LUAm2]KAI5177653.1 translocation protein SEC62 [Nematocida sp. LUAm1]